MMEREKEHEHEMSMTKEISVGRGPYSNGLKGNHRDKGKRVMNGHRGYRWGMRMSRREGCEVRSSSERIGDEET